VESIKVSPDKLDSHEAKFLHDLQNYIDKKQLDVTVLRNLPDGDIGLASDDGVFYPDFILWYKENQQEHIIFCDPKGIRNAEVKWKVCQAPYAIKNIETQWTNSNIYLHSFIVSHTPLDKVKWEPIQSLQNYDQCDVFYNLVFMDDKKYIARIFNGLTTNMAWHKAFQQCIPDIDKKFLGEWCDDNVRTEHVALIEKIQKSETLTREQAVLLYFKVWGATDKLKEKLKREVSDDVKEQVGSEILGEIVSDVIVDSIPYARTLWKIGQLILKK